MANLPAQYPDISLHLTDLTLTPLVTSARVQRQLAHLTRLSHTAQAAHGSAQRLGLGLPQRIIVEHVAGPMFLQTFLDLRPADDNASATVSALSTEQQNGQPENRGDAPHTITTTNAGADEEHDRPLFLGDDANLDDEEGPDPPPMLVGVVVAASTEDARQARRAAASLERVGRGIQEQWSKLQGQGAAPRCRGEQRRGTVVD